LGGVVIARGYGYTAPSWVGVGLAVLGLAVLGVSVLLHRRDVTTRRAVAAPAA
ncbi:MAG: MFS transporter, partial [Micrococcales bacterium]|nr:MFS transporter [Micrococcales bacterium]